MSNKIEVANQIAHSFKRASKIVDYLIDSELHSRLVELPTSKNKRQGFELLSARKQAVNSSKP